VLSGNSQQAVESFQGEDASAQNRRHALLDAVDGMPGNPHTFDSMVHGDAKELAVGLDHNL
jgi:hypothetical protein